MNALARVGVVQLLGRRIIGLLGEDFRAMPMQERQRYAMMATRPRAMETAIDEYEPAVASNATFQSYTIRKVAQVRGKTKPAGRMLLVRLTCLLLPQQPRGGMTNMIVIAI